MKIIKIKSENIGDKFSPCRTPLNDGKNADASLFATTFDLMLLYRL